MKNAIGRFFARVCSAGTRRDEAVKTVAMGRARVFRAWDVGNDTFVFEDGVASRTDERPSVLIVEKRNLGRKVPGRVMTVTTGNHSVAAFPLLDGRFWRLSRLPSNRRSEVLTHRILCANIVNGTIETSQRELAVEDLVSADQWLLGKAGFALDEVVMGDRNEAALAHYRHCGQEWRVKPLAWTETDMRIALVASRKHIATGISYYHSARGVHFLSYSEFMRLVSLSETAPDEFIRGLRELVSVYEGNRVSFTRMVKHRGHHEIELFGLQRGVAQERLIPAMERLMELIALNRIGRLGIIQEAHEIGRMFGSLLSQPELGDENSRTFAETLYMYVTGEIYAVAGEGSTPAFDDRRTALPGATFVNGNPVMHPGADSRSEVMLANLRSVMSKEEVVEYANVYELRSSDENVRLGSGKTREVVYKTNYAPLEIGLVEKRLSSARKGYGSYMFARVGAMRALGISMSGKYLLLRRRSRTGSRPVDFYIRRRCEGDPIDAIPENYFRSAGDSSAEDREVVLALAQLMGDAAAQNMAMKKFDPDTESPLFGIGKEIYEFEYDVVARRVVPKTVRVCSIRGSFGWPDTSHEEGNQRRVEDFYLMYFAHALRNFQRKHSVGMDELAVKFLDGFECRTHALAWKLSVMRDGFEAFQPDLPRAYSFSEKWRFVMWSLEQQDRRMDVIRRRFLSMVDAVKREDR